MSSPPNFHLTQHAQRRCAERIRLSAEELLYLLEHGAYKAIFTRSKLESLALPPEELEILRDEYGMNLREMARLGMVTFRPEYEHLLFWSEPDQQLLTAIVASEECAVVTVLYALEARKHDWSDRITDKVIRQVKQKYHDLFSPPQVENPSEVGVAGIQTKVPVSSESYELFCYWLDKQYQPCRKTIKWPQQNQQNLDDPFSPSADQIKSKIQPVIGHGYDVQVILRRRKSPDQVVLEYSLGDFLASESSTVDSP